MIGRKLACVCGTLLLCAGLLPADDGPERLAPRVQQDARRDAALFDASATPTARSAAASSKIDSIVADPAQRARHTAETADQALELRALKQQLLAESPRHQESEFTSRGGGDDCASATALTDADLPFYDAGDTCSAADDYNETCPLPGAGGRDVVYAFTPAADVAIDISLCQSSFDTKLYVYEQLCPDPGNPIACNEDACGADGYKSQIVALALTGGRTYYIVVDGFDATACGAYVLEIAEAASATPGDNCSDPIMIDVPEDLDFVDTNTTCGRGDDYDNTCMGVFDGGEDIVYQLNVSSETVLNISVQSATIWLGVAIDSWCPLDGVSCVASAASVENPDVIEGLTLAPGTYYLMVDTFPAPQCADFTLAITAQPLGACCIDGRCEIRHEVACVADGGVYAGDDTVCTDDLCLFGACCLSDGSCADRLTMDECESAGGVYQGHGSACDNASCPQPGDNCHLPITIELPADLPFTAANQTTCGRGNDYEGTCLDPFDRGEDIVYEVNVTSDVCVTVQLQDASVVWSGIAIGHSCPLEPDDCLGVSATTALIDRISGVYLPVGTYYIMVDTFPSPDCTPNFTLSITNSSSCAQGACCFHTTCSIEYEEACTSLGGVYLGNGTTCADSPCAAGACCLADGTCIQTVADECDGAFKGYGTACDDVYCAQPGDACETAGEIPTMPYSVTFDNSTFGADRPGASCDPYGTYPLMQNDVWFRWTANTDGTAVATAVPTGYNMVMAVWEGPDCDSLVEATCANSGTSTGNTETAVFEIIPGRTYWIQIGDTGPNPRGGSTNLDIYVTAGSGACCDPYTGDCTEGTLLECAALGGVYQGNGSTCSAGLCPLPPADDCGDAPSFAELSDLPFDTTTATAWGPTLPCGTGENVNLWYCYAPSQTGVATISLCGSSYDTRLAVYNGCNCYGTGYPMGDLIACNDDSDSCGLASEIVIPVLAGQSYLVEIGGYDGDSGPGLLSMSVEDGTLGACCLDGDPSCVEVDELVCDLMGGVYAGAGTTCDGDLDGNGMPDACDPDCNENGIIDGCDVTCDGGCATLPGCGQSLDCQGDAIPDECQLGNDLFHAYQWDDGTHEVEIGVGAGGYTCWINRFVIQEGAERIGAVSLAWGSVPEGREAAVYLWSDPDGDGDPTDAIVLSSASAVVTNAGTDTFAIVDIPIVEVGPAGTSFFVGAIVQHASDEKPASFDQDDDSTAYGQSWIVGDAATPIDPNNLGSAQGAPTNTDDISSLSGNWLLRALAAGPDNDCNDNGVPDDCEIADDPSLDCDGNGVIDSCESGDCNANGIPDVCDLLEGDCNANGIPDDCDLDPLDPDGDGSVSADCQPDGVPDECQLGAGQETVVLDESFEGGTFPPTGWENVALDALGPWTTTVNPNYVHDGIKAVVHPYSPVTYNADSYLLSPELELTEATLSVWSKGCVGQDWCDNYDVDVMIVVGEPGGTDDVFVGNLNELYVDYYETWVEGVFDLTPLLPAGPFRVAIRYSGINGDLGMIDDIRVYIPPPPPTNDQNNNGVPDDCENIPGDIDGDGDVDLTDLSALLGAYGTCVGDPGYVPAADIDDSGCVNLSDLGDLLAHYGVGV